MPGGFLSEWKGAGTVKLSIFSNDKTTCKDEIILSVITALAAVLGVFLIVKRSLFGAFSGIAGTAGVVILVFVVMMSVIIAYRFATNYKDNK